MSPSTCRAVLSGDQHQRSLKRQATGRCRALPWLRVSRARGTLQFSYAANHAAARTRQMMPARGSRHLTMPNNPPGPRPSGRASTMAIVLVVMAAVVSALIAGTVVGAVVVDAGTAGDVEAINAPDPQRQAEQAETETELAEIAAELADAQAELEAEQQRVKTISKERDDEADARRAAVETTDELQLVVDELRAKYEPEIRAELEQARAAEIERACAAAADNQTGYDSIVEWDDEWRHLSSKAKLIEEVAACADPLRARGVRERCEPVPADQVVRQTETLAENCYQMWVVPWQWDSRTGECAFLGKFSSTNHGTRAFRYDHDALFALPAEVCEAALGDADQDDLLQVWAVLVGPYRYDTAAGGTNEIPEFAVVDAELVTKA